MMRAITLDDVKAEIKRLLRANRPDRYTLHGEGSEWLTDVIAEVAPMLDGRLAPLLAAGEIVRRMEGAMTRETNQIMRHCIEQPPLDWSYFHDCPLAVRDERVAIRAATPADFKQFADEEDGRASRDFEVRRQTATSARLIAARMIANGWTTGAQLRW